MQSLIRLTAGPLSMLYDPQHAFLRCIRLREIEVVRGIFAAVRDQDWNTIPFSVHDYHLEQSDGSFQISFLARCAQDSIQFEWRGEVTGTRAGTVCFKFSGLALNTFKKNRIGLCVLHPIAGCAGQACRVEHLDGSTTVGEFPKWISPTQPFKNIKSITHRVEEGADVRVHFAGEAFEMEDQRNWTDASYKTYSTPLELPFPVEVPAGARLDHSVTVEIASLPSQASVQGVLTESRSLSDAPREKTGGGVPSPRIHINWQSTCASPTVGFSMSTASGTPSEAVIERLRDSHPDHLRVDVRLTSGEWKERASEAVELAYRLDAKVEVALFIESMRGGAWDDCLQILREHRGRIARCLIFHPDAKTTPPDLARAAYRELEDREEIPVVIGTNVYFAELNRGRPPARRGSLVCYSMNPQVHAFDNLSLRETLEAQPWTVDSARELFQCKVVVSPLTLRPRFNPNATSKSSTGGERFVEPQTDSRQSSNFIAAWTAAALAQLAPHPAIDSLTFYETFGPRGIMDMSGNPYPVFSVFKMFNDFDLVCRATSSRPLDISAVGLKRGDGCRGLLLANMSDQSETVTVESSDAGERQFELGPESIQLLAGEEFS